MCYYQMGESTFRRKSTLFIMLSRQKFLELPDSGFFVIQDCDCGVEVCDHIGWQVFELCKVSANGAQFCEAGLDDCLVIFLPAAEWIEIALTQSAFERFLLKSCKGGPG